MWHITAHPKGSTIWKAALKYGVFPTQKDAQLYIHEHLDGISSVEFFPTIDMYSSKK